MAKVSEYIDYLEDQLEDLTTNRRMDAILNRLYKAHVVFNLSNPSKARSTNVASSGITELIEAPGDDEEIQIESIDIGSDGTGMAISSTVAILSGNTVIHRKVVAGFPDPEYLSFTSKSPLGLGAGNALSISSTTAMGIIVNIVYRIVKV